MILKIRNENGQFKDVPAIQGIQGPQGDKGDQGIQGPKGDDGYTPIKGVDYFTQSDIDEIVTEVLSEVVNGNEVAY